MLVLPSTATQSVDDTQETAAGDLPESALSATSAHVIPLLAAAGEASDTTVATAAAVPIAAAIGAINARAEAPNRQRISGVFRSRRILVPPTARRNDPKVTTARPSISFGYNYETTTLGGESATLCSQYSELAARTQGAAAGGRRAGPERSSVIMALVLPIKSKAAPKKEAG